ncbi:winged helix-turn-helix transcriptional regulator [Chitinophaga sp. RAB17]|uniref:winged helix-turn-helix transcriptional regulator n=1 Tax=Chitinophaga sp. RAB17 TaxID=3233049 RepID=UPI003F913A34
MKTVEKKSKAYQEFTSTYAIYNSCPVTATIKIIGGKWKVIILYLIAHDVNRFGEMMRNIEGISKKMLTDQLRQLEIDGVIARKVFTEIPLKVEYSLTTLGESLKPITKLMCKWGLEKVLAAKN